PALSSFPYPLSFAVDPTWDGAAEAMRRYRDAGFEVLVMVDLPEGAQASDTEIAMQMVLNAVPEAVAVLEGTGTGLQSGRAAAEQLAPILLESGHGLVLFSNGLDTARKLISREGVPTGSVFRDFDAKGQNATVIRRFLDQAAFKAGRGQGEVIMLGRLRADTISALLLWGLQDRASSVAIAPISAVLTEQR
ncbi:MAG: divergent polysaccharide deacetylase family protein, partial [Thalassovita sp.]|nr:divergent polysaccharide deacetylase family protein [Thalassovita sp.]